MRGNTNINKNGSTSKNLLKEEKEIFIQLREAYNSISNSYLRLKRQPWKQFEQLINRLLNEHLDSYGGALLDAGCGNGRNLSIFDGFSSKIGIDPIENLVIQVPKYNGIPVLGSITHVPFKKNSFELIISVAVIHHFKHQKTRQMVIHELLELLKTNGLLIITVWKRDRPGKIGDVILKLVQGENSQDEYLPWKNTSGEIIANRYYHYFTRHDFKELLSPFQKHVVEWGTFGGKIKQNFYAVFRK